MKIAGADGRVATGTSGGVAGGVAAGSGRTEARPGAGIGVRAAAAGPGDRAGVAGVIAGAGFQCVTHRALRARLLDHVYPALRDHGDTETVTRLLRRLDDRGTGAGRQRALFTRAASPPAFITALARATLSGHEPGPLGVGPRPEGPPAATAGEWLCGPARRGSMSAAVPRGRGRRGNATFGPGGPGFRP